ncbi:hypothetical protein JVU11DRAFT_720 [Chiua virens]|nr:hypothetical protein JVU11DRAFT_720 [Chiua virens]
MNRNVALFAVDSWKDTSPVYLQPVKPVYTAEQLPTATYGLIYRFLKQQSQNKAAEAVKKAARNIVVLRDDIEQKGPPLEDIIGEWKQSKENTKADDDSESSSEESDSSDEETSDESDDSSSADSSSEDTSDSESDDDDTSDDSSDESDEENPTKKSPQKPVESDTSATLSSAGEKEIADQSAKIVVKATKDNNEDAESNNSSSESAASDNSDAESSSNSSDSSSSSESSNEEAENSTQQPSPSERDESNSSESSDGEEEKPATQPPPGKPKRKQPSPSESSSSESSSESEDESDSEPGQKVGEHIAKKRKISETGAAMATAHPSSVSESVAQQKKEKPPPKVKERFQRVKVQDIVPETLLSNGYEARGGASNDYGERAHRDLIVTRGAGFRKEKNKKKRGSYRGGEITMENHSIKFDF